MQRLESLCVASMLSGCPETVLGADPGASWPMGGQSVFWLVGGLAKEWGTSQDFWRTWQKQVWDSRWLVAGPTCSPVDTGRGFQLAAGSSPVGVESSWEGPGLRLQVHGGCLWETRI